MPDFVIQDVAGFTGRFAVTVGSVPLIPTPEQSTFCDRIDALMARYDALGDPRSVMRALREEARAHSLTELRTTAEDFVAGRLDAQRAILTTYVVQGRWEAAFEQLSGKLFVVSAVDAKGEPIASSTNSGPAVDLKITIIKDVTIPQDKLRFKVDIDRTLTVIKVILPVEEEVQQAGATAGTTAAIPARPCVLAAVWEALGGYLGNLAIVRCLSGMRLTRRPQSVLLRRSNYIRQLAGAARVGLETNDPSLTVLAAQSLDSLREEIVALEAGAVKNRYLWRLGTRCLLVAIVFVAAYWLISAACPIHRSPTDYARACSWPIASAYRNFFLLAAGTAVGTWLSFSLRRVILTFLDLASLEEDRLDPTMRVLFITALASVVGLLFWTEAVTIGIGKFQSSFATNGTFALLIGLLLGIAERAMATAVSKRATDFAGAIGGK